MGATYNGDVLYFYGVDIAAIVDEQPYQDYTKVSRIYIGYPGDNAFYV